ncbi:BppU family phage baseplate upper protein [Staphylococcus nepalensis]|uniref:BppU family phage baseplate upper protein n=1 Tax=Staphylococcus nepalensis TaxID=214473 RepID=UPI001C3E9939|nr:BppU family phage baseplate upper protein [Staphylococcus nepalensis]
MASNLDKKTILNMENTARYQAKQDLNIKFSTADRDSAVFVFNVTKNKKPLLLSEVNVLGHIALKHSDGSFIKDTLHFTEHDINGKFEYYIPNELLKREGTVTMQVFISEKGNSNVTVAERIVTFDIEKSIVSQISAETKLQYIIEYDELQAIIANRITDIEDKMANAEDYVSQLKQAREKGLADKRLEEINNKASVYSSKFDDDKQYMDDKHQAFKESVLNSEVVTQGESKEWQKYKLTNDDGNYPLIDLQNKNENYYNLKTGVYYTTNTPHGISGVTTAGFSEMKIRISSTVKRLTFKPYNSNRVFEKWFYNEWSDWKEIPTLPLDEEIETQNSAESRANETLADANRYTDEQLSKQHTVLFEGSANGVNTEFNLTDSIYNYSLVMISGKFPGGTFNEPVLVSNVIDNITIQRFNLTDAEGQLVEFYESSVNVKNGIKPFIRHDVAFDYKNLKPSGKDKNAFTITKVEGWK